MLFNEPKLLKSNPIHIAASRIASYVSVLFNEPKLLKWLEVASGSLWWSVSVLFNEPKLLKWRTTNHLHRWYPGFSALQRAEIAEI